MGWGKTGGLYGYNTAVPGTPDLSRTLVHSVNSTQVKGRNMNRVVGRIIAAAFTH
ncbi:hypothetical protein ABZX75_28745 [Streptomyces sp. NPDC003038]|uniref:hypothetical protein n=1 Tax=unclassified Streptomyces TaxID=2593676 RepID=UPI0033A7CB30